MLIPPDYRSPDVSYFDMEVGAAGGDPEAFTVRALGTNVSFKQHRTREYVYPALVVYRSGAETWEVIPTTGTGYMTAFQPLGKPVVLGAQQLFVLGSVGRAHPGRVMALDMTTRVWRVAAVQGVQFRDTLVASMGRVFVVSQVQEKIIEPGSELSRSTSADSTRIVPWMQLHPMGLFWKVDAISVTSTPWASTQMCAVRTCGPWQSRMGSCTSLAGQCRNLLITQGWFTTSQQGSGDAGRWGVLGSKKISVVTFLHPRIVSRSACHRAFIYKLHAPYCV